MSKVFKVVATVAGVASLALAFVPGGQIIAGIAAAKLGAIAGAVSAISGTLAQVTAKPPRAKGQVAQITVGANQPMPYMIGRSYSGGALIHDIGYGGLVSKVDNPYRAMTVVYSGAGPISALVAIQADFTTLGFAGTAATGYYSGFLWADWLDGTGPAPRALAAQFAGEPGWSSAHKLSGFFGAKFTLKFDKEGKAWQAGVPQFGVIADGVRAYDPRLDSTRPGGSGSQRITDETTWAFTKNPALHALTYAYGRYQNGKKVFGVDLGDSGVDIATTMAWANVCDANGWEVNGTIFEPDDKWNNLKLICEAGGGVPVPGARLRFDYNAPGVAVDTITIDDLGDGEISLPVTQGYASGLNTVQGVYTSPAHRWEPQPTDKIVDTALLASDGEEKAEQFPFKLVTSKDQAAELAAYKMVNSREKGPIVLPVKARLLTYPVGTFLTAQLPTLGLPSQKVKIIGKRRTMTDGSGEITVVTETDAKHAFALAAVSGAPPSSALVPPERLDELAISFALPPSTQAPSPPPSNVIPGHIYIDGTGHKYRFDGLQLTFNGEPLLFGGQPIFTSGYSDAQDQATLQALADAAAADAAAAAAQNAAIIAQGLAADAQATADGKVQTYYQTGAPTAEGIGDLWFDTDDGNKQYRWSGSAWVAVQDAGIGQAITDAAGAQATADGKVTTFYVESTPTAEALGDLWYQPSSEYLRRWDGSGWVIVSNVGARTAQFPAAPPADWDVGSIYIDGTGKKFRFSGKPLLFGGSPLTFNGDPIYTSGYTDAQDRAVLFAIEEAQAAQAAADLANAAIAQIDDDDIITISEKVEVLIPGAAAFEALYAAVLANATTAGVSVTTLNTRRTAWLSALAAISPAWNNITAASPVVRGSLDTARSQYDSELKNVQQLAIEAMTAAKQVVIVPPVPQIVYRDWLGAVKGSQYNRTLTPKVERGGIDIRTSNDVTYAITTTGTITATVNNTTASADKGRITATGGSSGSILLTITVSGVAQPVFTIPFTNQDDNPPTTGGGGSGNTGGSDSTLEDVTSTSFAAITQQDGGESVFLIDITSGQTINGTAPLTYTKSGTSATQVAMVAKWQYRLQGSGTWLDFAGSSITGTGAFWNSTDFIAEAGEITANQSKSGLATGTYECQLVAAKDSSATGNLQVVSGTATVSKS